MRFHFRSESHAIGGVLTQPHPSYLVILDAHSSTTHPPTSLEESIGDTIRSAGGVSADMHRKNKKERQEERTHPNPADDEGEAPASVGLNSSWKSKRALHIEQQEEESPTERHGRRQFFRLGRHRNRSSSASSTSAKSLSPPPTGRRQRSPSNKSRNFVGLRKPVMMKRTMSLPHDLKAASAEESSTATATACSCSSSMPLPSKQGHRRQVTFSSVQIREYSRILGDHPCCPSGPPLSLGWETEREDSFRLDDYEEQRDPIRRSKEDFRLGCQDRREILESLVISPHSSDSEGECAVNACCIYSKAEIRRVERKLNRERAENHRAVRRMNNRFFQPVENAPATMDISPRKAEEDKPQDET